MAFTVFNHKKTALAGRQLLYYLSFLVNYWILQKQKTAKQSLILHQRSSIPKKSKVNFEFIRNERKLIEHRCSSQIQQHSTQPYSQTSAREAKGTANGLERLRIRLHSTDQNPFHDIFRASGRVIQKTASTECTKRPKRPFKRNVINLSTLNRHTTD